MMRIKAMGSLSKDLPRLRFAAPFARVRRRVNKSAST